jgi:hypothetical protein
MRTFGVLIVLCMVAAPLAAHGRVLHDLRSSEMNATG